MINSLFGQIKQLRATINSLESLKIDLYINDFLTSSKNSSTSEESLKLYNNINKKLEEDLITKYFLIVLNYKIQIHNNQLSLEQFQFENLNKNFNNIVKSNFFFKNSDIENKLISEDNISLIIHNSSRVYLETKNTQDKTFLLVNLDSPILHKFETWQHFFIFRINRKAIALNKFDKDQSLKNKMKTYSAMLLSQNRGSEDMKIKKMALKEIGFYLTQVKTDPRHALEILIRLFKAFKIEKEIIQTVFFTNQQYNRARLDQNLNQALKKKKKVLSVKDATKDEKMIFVLKKSFEFLEGDKSLSEILILNKNIRKNLKKKFIKEILVSLVCEPELSHADIAPALFEMLEPEYQVKTHLTKKCKSSELNDIKLTKKEIDTVQLDLSRTRGEKHTIFRIKKLIYNFMHQYGDTIGYFQGLNFLSKFLICSFPEKDKKADDYPFAVLSALVDRVYSKFFDFKEDSKSGKNLLILFYILQRLMDINLPNLSIHFNREGIISQQFAANLLITMFSSYFTEDIKSPLLVRYISVAIEEGWAGIFKIFLSLLKICEKFILQCEMEEFMFFWTYLLKYPGFWQKQESYSFGELETMINPKLLQQLDLDLYYSQIRRMEYYDEMKVTPESLEVLREEFLLLSRSFKEMYDEVED